MCETKRVFVKCKIYIGTRVLPCTFFLRDEHFADRRLRARTAALGLKQLEEDLVIRGNDVNFFFGGGGRKG